MYLWMLDFIDKVAMLSVKWPQSDKLHAFPCWGHNTNFCESEESKEKDSFENNLFFSLIYHFSIWKRHQCTVYWTQPFLSFLSNILPNLWSSFFFCMHRQGVIDYIQGEETSGSLRWATEHLCVTCTKVFSWNESKLQQYKLNSRFFSKCPSHASWGTISL